MNKQPYLIYWINKMETKNFILDTDYIELCSLLKSIGVISTGGEAKAAITQGLVKVNDKVETRKRHKIRAGQRVQFESLEIVTISKI